MPTCLVCLEERVPATHVMCRGCFGTHKQEIAEVQASPLTFDELKKKLWGQSFERNRTPANRARIAYAAHLLAEGGHPRAVAEVEAALFSAPHRSESAPVPLALSRAPNRAQENPAPSTHATQAAQEVSHLETALGERDPKLIQQPGKFRTRDGHFVRSKSEAHIADFLYDNRIRYAYERQIAFGEVDLYPDFWLPDAAGGGIYLEHFGMLDNPRYKQLATWKAAAYSERGLRLVATDEADALDFDSALRKKLGKYFPELNSRS